MALASTGLPENDTINDRKTIGNSILLFADAEARLEKVYGLIPELREFAPRKGLQLSGGQQKLVALGRLQCGMRESALAGMAPGVTRGFSAGDAGTLTGK